MASGSLSIRERIPLGTDLMREGSVSRERNSVTTTSKRRSCYPTRRAGLASVWSWTQPASRGSRYWNSRPPEQPESRFALS